jgi:hypothetical protein
VAGGRPPELAASPETVRRAQPPPRLAVRQATRWLDLTDEPFLFFVDSATGRGSVAYRRRDGHYGLIAPA